MVPLLEETYLPSLDFADINDCHHTTVHDTFKFVSYDASICKARTSAKVFSSYSSSGLQMCGLTMGILPGRLAALCVKRSHRG